MLQCALLYRAAHRYVVSVFGHFTLLHARAPSSYDLFLTEQKLMKVEVEFAAALGIPIETGLPSL